MIRTLNSAFSLVDLDSSSKNHLHPVSLIKGSI